MVSRYHFGVTTVLLFGLALSGNVPFHAPGLGDDGMPYAVAELERLLAQELQFGGHYFQLDFSHLYCCYFPWKPFEPEGV